MKSQEKIFSFNLPEIAQALVGGLQVALEEVMPEIMSDNNLFTHNGAGQFRWNPIITQLKDVCEHLGWAELGFGVCHRGAWKTPVLFNPKSRYIFTFMTESTFKGLQWRKNKGKHYLCGGAFFNQDVVPQFEQLELDLPPVTVDAQEWVAQSSEQLAQAVRVNVGEIQGHILVLFDVHSDKLLTVRAIRLTPALEISMEEEDWSRYIRQSFAASQMAEPQMIDGDEDDEDLVQLL